MNRLILASASPQRAELLEGLNLSFVVIPSHYDESLCTETNPILRCQMLAKLKAEEVQSHEKNAWIIGCDTLVVAHDGTLLEKPVDAAETERMLRLHSGNCSTVHSGLCVIAPDGSRHEGLHSTDVYFMQLTDDTIDWWISTGLWKDRSGGFQIDGKGQMMIERIDGEWASVVGMPIFLLGKLLRESGYTVT